MVKMKLSYAVCTATKKERERERGPKKLIKISCTGNPPVSLLSLAPNRVLQKSALGSVLFSSL